MMYDWQNVISPLIHKTSIVTDTLTRIKKGKFVLFSLNFFTISKITYNAISSFNSHMYRNIITIHLADIFNERGFSKLTVYCTKRMFNL